MTPYKHYKPPECTLSLGLSKQEYWSGLPFPTPGDLPNPGIEPGSLTSLALALAVANAPLAHLESQDKGH